jgi:hypothetical protein
MQILRVASAETDLEYRWPDNAVETYPAWISYVGVAGGGPVGGVACKQKAARRCYNPLESSCPISG